MIRSGTVVAAIQARMSSSRLPGKVLADLGGKPLIQHVYERARHGRCVDEAVVVTSTEPSDDPLVACCETHGIPVRRGALHDVLSRYLAVLDEFDPRWVVRVTGDCPLIEPSFIDHQVDALRACDGDMTVVTNGRVDGVLGGQGVLSARALRAAAESTDPRDREHVGSFYLTENHARFRLIGIEAPAGYFRTGMRLAVDEPADLERTRAIFEALGDKVSVLEALAWLDENPAIKNLGEAVEESRDNRDLQEKRGQIEWPLAGRWP